MKLFQLRTRELYEEWNETKEQQHKGVTVT